MTNGGYGGQLLSVAYGDFVKKVTVNKFQTQSMYVLFNSSKQSLQRYHKIWRHLSQRQYNNNF